MTEIDDALIEGLLKEARAPAVISREGLAILTQCLAEIDHYASGRISPKTRKRGDPWDDAGEKLGNDYKRAKAAESVVPEIIAALRLVGWNPAEAENLEAWLKTIPDFSPNKHGQSWAHHAVCLFAGYQHATGHCGVSRDGAVVRFIKLALDRYGYHKNHEAIFDALREARKRKRPEAVRYFQ